VQLPSITSIYYRISSNKPRAVLFISGPQTVSVLIEGAVYFIQQATRVVLI